MAQIPQYDAGNVRLQPSDRAAESSVMAGRRIAQQYNEAADATNVLGHEVGSTIAQVGNAYEDHQFHKEVSSGSLAASNILLQRQKNWSDKIKDPNTDPNDPALQEQFLRDNEDIYEKFRDGFSTKKGQAWAEHRIETFRNHFNETTTVDISTLSGVKAHNDLVQGVNLKTASVTLDPTVRNLDLQADLLTQDIQALREAGTGMKGAAGALFEAKAKQAGMEQLVKAAVQSSIRKGGDGSEITDDPKYSPYVNAQERQQFVSMQRQEQRLANAEARAQKQWQKEEAQNTSDQTMLEFVRNLNSNKPTLTRDQINEAADDKRLTPRGYMQMINIFDRETKPPTSNQASQENARVLFNDIRRAADDPKRITSLEPIWAAYGDGKLTRADRDDLVKSYVEMRTPEGQKLNADVKDFLSHYKDQLNKSVMNKIDPGGGAREYHFEQALRREMEARRLEGKNPRDLLDDTKPEFFGRPSNVLKYITAQDAAIRALVKGGTQDRQKQLDDILNGAK